VETNASERRIKENLMREEDIEKTHIMSMVETNSHDKSSKTSPLRVPHVHEWRQEGPLQP